VRLGSSDAHMWDHALVDPHVGPCTDGAHSGTMHWWGHAMVGPRVGGAMRWCYRTWDPDPQLHVVAFGTRSLFSFFKLFCDDNVVVL
jgi:hypothetical protein